MCTAANEDPASFLIRNNGEPALLLGVVMREGWNGRVRNRRWLMKTRRQITREFKMEAVRLVRERRVTAAQAARDLGVHQNVLRNGVRELAADP
jgi:hypothetical protein